MGNIEIIIFYPTHSSDVLGAICLACLTHPSLGSSVSLDASDSPVSDVASSLVSRLVGYMALESQLVPQGTPSALPSLCCLANSSLLEKAHELASRVKLA